MKKKGISVLLVIAVLTVLFYGYRYVRIPVETDTAKISQIEDVISADAYVCRQEAVYTAQKTGTMYSYHSEGARVAKNMKLVTVFHGEIKSEVVQELNNIDLKIDELQKEKDEKFTVDKSSSETKIELLKDNIINDTIKGDISKISEYKNNIKILYNIEGTNEESKLDSMKKRKAEIETALGSDKSDIISTISGVFSKNTDGLENVLTPEAIMKYKVNDFNNITPPTTDEDIDSSVEYGEQVCKVVDNHVWYAVTMMTKEKAEQIKDNKNLLVRFDSIPGVEVNAEVCYISQEAEDEKNAVVVLKSEHYLEGVYGIRYGKMDIIASRYTGFEIPIYSLRNVDGKKGVMVSKGNDEIFCQCDVVFTDDEKGTMMVYPTSDAKVTLNIGDKIILGEKSKK